MFFLCVYVYEKKMSPSLSLSLFGLFLLRYSALESFLLLLPLPVCLYFLLEYV